MTSGPPPRRPRSWPRYFPCDEGPSPPLPPSPQTSILGKVKDILALPRDDASKDDKIKALRTDINGWVATYRREPRTSGRPSYG